METRLLSSIVFFLWKVHMKRWYWEWEEDACVFLNIIRFVCLVWMFGILRGGRVSFFTETFLESHPVTSNQDMTRSL